MDIRERISELVDANNDTLWIGEVSSNSIELDGCLTIESLRGIVEIMSGSAEIKDLAVETDKGDPGRWHYSTVQKCWD